MLLSFNESPLNYKTARSPLGAVIKNKTVENCLHDAERITSKKILSRELFQAESQNDNTQVKYYLSLIKDPLWNHVCTEVISMMGPRCNLKIWESRLGMISLDNKTIEIYCQTEELTRFLQQYDFVVLGGLQRYFPSIKELIIRTGSEITV